MTNDTNGYVQTQLQDGIATITFYHPQANSLPGHLLTSLAKEIDFLSNEESTMVIILQSAGDKAFCAGASFDELTAIKNEEEGFKFFSGFAHVINAIRKCPKFVIARIQGRCVGGGVGLAAAADYAIATQAADIKLSELAIGIGPFVVGPAVERKTGLSAFAQLSINATTWYSAGWAKDKGLFAEVHPSVAEVDDAVNKLATQLRNSSPSAMAELKAITWEGTSHWDKLLKERAAISGKLILSDFSRHALAAMKKK